MLNPHTPGYPFPSAGHTCIRFYISSPDVHENTIYRHFLAEAELYVLETTNHVVKNQIGGMIVSSMLLGQNVLSHASLW